MDITILMPKVFKDITNIKFGTLLALYSDPVIHRLKDGRAVKHWICQCDCGNLISTNTSRLLNGNCKSCGDREKHYSGENSSQYKHGLGASRLCGVLSGMRRRCYNPKCKEYKYYGERGITICDEWLNPESGLVSFYNWAMENGYKEGLEIERKKNHLNYAPENCCWATRKEQMNNQRKNRTIMYDGILYSSVKKLVDTYGKCSYRLFFHRIDNLKWSIKEALLTPPNMRGILCL